MHTDHDNNAVTLLVSQRSKLQ